jgi:hypothetical protein
MQCQPPLALRAPSRSILHDWRRRRCIYDHPRDALYCGGRRPRLAAACCTLVRGTRATLDSYPYCRLPEPRQFFWHTSAVFLARPCGLLDKFGVSSMLALESLKFYHRRRVPHSHVCWQVTECLCQPTTRLVRGCGAWYLFAGTLMLDGHDTA